MKYTCIHCVKCEIVLGPKFRFYCPFIRRFVERDQKICEGFDKDPIFALSEEVKKDE